MNSRDVLRNGYDAFISHNHADKAWARELAARLAKVDFHGRLLRVWLDDWEIHPGDSIPAKIEERPEHVTRASLGAVTDADLKL